MEHDLVCDTGTLLSLKIAQKDFYFINLGKFNFVLSLSAEQELKQFARYDDLLGNCAKEILQERLIIKKDIEINDLKIILGVSGKQRITETDLSLFAIAQKEGLPFFTDDFSVLIHLSSFYPEENIFHGVALLASLLLEKLSVEKIYDYIFKRFIPLRWKSMTEQRIIDIETILQEVLEKG